MKKIFNCFFLLLLWAGLNAQSITKWTFENISTAVPSVPIEASSHSWKIDRARAYLYGGNNNGSPDVCHGAESWSTNFWPTSSGRSGGDYMEFKAVAKNRYDLIVTQFAFAASISSTSGPRSFDVYYSVDGGAEKFLASRSSSLSSCRWYNFSLDEQTSSGGSISFRIYPYKQNPAAQAASMRIDDVSIRGQVLLPVRLIKWTGEVQENGILLRWSTANEKSSDYFSIERRTKHAEFEEIERRSAKGFTNENSDYAFFDAYPASGQNYYRLKQVDIDGSFVYSDVIVLEYEPESGIQIYPTLSQAQLKLDLRKLKTAGARVSINNVNGYLIWSRSYFYPLSLETIDISDFEKGMYLLIVESDQGREVKRFIRL